MPRTLAVICLTAAIGVAAPVPKQVKARPDLNGRWEAVEMTCDGKDSLRSNRWVWEIDGERLTAFRKEKDGTHAPIDPETSLALRWKESGTTQEIDYVAEIGGQKAVYHALVAVEGEELVICFPTDAGPDRPTALKAGPNVTYCRFKRVVK